MPTTRTKRRTKSMKHDNMGDDDDCDGDDDKGEDEDKDIMRRTSTAK